MLELLGVSRRFGDLVALDDVSFSVERGQLCGFLGPNGAGKTTAMRIVMGITSPDAGAVRWEGEPLAREVRHGFGYMPEERGLYPKMRALEQIVYFGRLHGLTADEARRRGEDWLERVGLSERADARLEELSQGNQQRVQLAAALVHDPELLVLDEPFSGLDPIAVDVMSNVLRERAAAGAAVLFSSHQLDLVEDLCERVAIISQGRLVMSGRVRALQDASATRLVVGVEGGAGWWTGLRGVELASSNEDTVTLVLAESVDPDTVLHAAQAAGALRHFAHARPHLSELFREAVRAERS